MKPVHDWRVVLRRAWSVRLSLLASLFGAWSTYWTDREYGVPLYITLPFVGFTIAAAVARIVKQGYSDDT